MHAEFVKDALDVIGRGLLRDDQRLAYLTIGEAGYDETRDDRSWYGTRRLQLGEDLRAGHPPALPQQTSRPSGERKHEESWAFSVSLARHESSRHTGSR